MSSDIAKKIEAYYAEWLRRYKTAAEIAPDVQRQYELAQWQAKAYEVPMPDEVRHEIDPGLGRNLEILKERLPLSPIYCNTLALGTSTTSAASLMTSALSDMLREYREYDHVDELLGQYRQLQDKHVRINEARLRLERVFPLLLDLFDTAQRAVSMFKLDVEQAASAASELRNLLDKLKGELFRKAQHHKGDNMTWEIMSERLTVIRASASDRQVLLEQEIQRSRLYGDLSSIAKRRNLNMTQVEMLWPRVVDHVYVVCGCLM